MTPLGTAITLVLAMLVFSQSRVIAAVIIIVAVCYLTQGMPLNVVVFHFTAMRVILLAGILRVVARGELTQLRLNTLDRAILAYMFAIPIISVLRNFTTEQMIYQVGCLYDVLLAYFVFRSLLQGSRDYLDVLGKVSFLLIPLAFMVVSESVTGRNCFAAFGGVGEISWIRDEHVRIQAAFRCPITAGAFGATFTLLFASILFAKGRSLFALVGLGCSLVIVLLARSSGPFMGLLVGLVALFGFWPLRTRMRSVRWSIVAVLVLMQLIMRAPVWFLLGRISEVVGGGGYHRAELIDQFINHFSTWWLVGMRDTSDWFPYQLADGQADLTNRFVADGVTGGLLGLILSITLVVRSFQRIGLAMKSSRREGSSSEKAVWGLGATMVGSIGILFSVDYFDQMQVIWYFLLACIASLEIRKYPARRPAPAREDQGTSQPAHLQVMSRERAVEFRASTAQNGTELVPVDRNLY